MNDTSVTSSPPASVYTDLLQRYLDPTEENLPLLGNDVDDENVFDLPNEFYLDDAIVAECAAYWAPHYLHQDGTLSPELVEIITNINNEQQKKLSIHKTSSTHHKNNTGGNWYNESSGNRSFRSAHSISSPDALLPDSEEVVNSIDCPSFTFGVNGGRVGQVCSNVRNVASSNHAALPTKPLEIDSNVPNRTSKGGGTKVRRKTNGATRRRNATAKPSTTIATSSHRDLRNNSNPPCPLIICSDAEASTSSFTADRELNEEQKSALVKQLVRLIKDQTKELEENKTCNTNSNCVLQSLPISPFVATTFSNESLLALHANTTKNSSINHQRITNCVAGDGLPLTNQRTCQVPTGWERLCLSDPRTPVIYISPSGVVLSNIAMIRSYLLESNTCKCGIDCPLNVSEAFNFDPLVTSCYNNVASIEEGSKKRQCTCLLSHNKLTGSSTILPNSSHKNTSISCQPVNPGNNRIHFATNKPRSDRVDGRQASIERSGLSQRSITSLINPTSNFVQYTPCASTNKSTIPMTTKQTNGEIPTKKKRNRKKPNSTVIPELPTRPNGNNNPIQSADLLSDISFDELAPFKSDSVLIHNPSRFESPSRISSLNYSEQADVINNGLQANHPHSLLVDSASSFNQTMDKFDESDAIHQLFSILKSKVTNKTASVSKASSTKTSSSKKSNALSNLLTNEFLPNVEFMRNLNDSEMQNFAKHLVFTSQANENNGFALNCTKTRPRPRKRNTTAKPRQPTRKSFKSVKPFVNATATNGHDPILSGLDSQLDINSKDEHLANEHLTLDQLQRLLIPSNAAIDVNRNSPSSLVDNSITGNFLTSSPYASPITSQNVQSPCSNGIQYQSNNNFASTENGRWINFSSSNDNDNNNAYKCTIDKAMTSVNGETTLGLNLLKPSSINCPTSQRSHKTSLLLHNGCISYRL